MYTDGTCTMSTSTTCVAPAFCSTGSASCLYPAPTVTGALSISPKLTPSGKTAQISWNISNVQSCTVQGSNKDGTGTNSTGLWNTLSGTKTSSPITSQTIYTLTCIPDDPTASLFKQTATVNIAPTFKEQ